MSFPGEFDFPISRRWTIERVLGSGGFGIVYAAFDRQRSERVAMKMLRQYEPAALNRFKREFRSLVDLIHPNLVSLYELVAEQDLCFFTMELVEGGDVVTYLRPGQRLSLEDTDTGSGDSSSGCDAFDANTKTKPARKPASASVTAAPRNANELRPVFRQLAEGLVALHQADKLHRDIKPTNILVDRDGRVVILDFGLVTDLISNSADSGVVGTFNYMSPEQADGRVLSKASDWYSFGVVLYEALTGVRPREAFHVLFDKPSGDPTRARKIVPETPRDLDDLCMRLLARDPRDRPTGDEVLAAFGAVSNRHRRPPSGVLVGRDHELGVLERAFERAQSGCLVALHVQGTSGIGKSSLVQHFLRGLAQGTDALIFQGRCYQRESVPYKALDSLIDAMARHLGRLELPECERLVPTSIGALARIFPVLQALKAVANTPHGRRSPTDPQELRRRAATAFEQLLANLSAARPVVIFVDDLQWGDLDSTTLLMEVMRTRSRMALLLISCFRTEDRETSPWLQALLSPVDVTAHVQEMEVRALTEDSAAILVRRFLYEIKGNDTLDKAIVREAAGNPFLIQELVGYIAESNVGQVGHTISFESVLRARLERLPETARQLLITVALAGQPISELSAVRAAGIEGYGSAAVAVLTSNKLIRILGGEGDQLVTFHDRIREAVLAQVRPDQMRHGHSRLAAALEATQEASAETLAVHYESAEEWTSAASYAAIAARHAAAALAFQRAANLYQHALTLRLRASGHASAPSDAEGRALQAGLAEALSNAGRGLEAGQAYLAACENAQLDERLERQRRAAEQFLHSGHIDRGIEILKSVLSAVRIRLPEKSAWLVPRLLILRMQIGLRGLRWRERQASQIPPDTLLRIDACSAAATGLALVDVGWGAVIQASHLLLALRAGENYRIARALAMDAGYCSSGGRRAQRRAIKVLAKARALAERIGQPHTVGLSLVMGAASSWNRGLWRECYDQAREARELLRERCSGVTWELDTANIFVVDSLRWMGGWREMGAILPAMIVDARERGDLYAETILQMHCGSCAALAQDDPERAREGLDILRRWSNSGFRVAHLIEAHNQVEIALYRGEAEGAMGFVSERWPALRRSLLLHVRTFRIQMLSLRARAALCLAADKKREADRRALLSHAARDSRAIRRQRAAWAVPIESMLQACIASISGRTSEAIELFRRTEVSAEKTDMILHAAVAKRCYGLLLGTAGQDIVAEADARIAAEDIRNADRLSAVIAPGIRGA